jgi:hypothetical protein
MESSSDDDAQEKPSSSQRRVGKGKVCVHIQTYHDIYTHIYTHVLSCTHVLSLCRYNHRKVHHSGVPVPPVTILPATAARKSSPCHSPPSTLILSSPPPSFTSRFHSLRTPCRCQVTLRWMDAAVTKGD